MIQKVKMFIIDGSRCVSFFHLKNTVCFEVPIFKRMIKEGVSVFIRLAIQKRIIFIDPTV